MASLPEVFKDRNTWGQKLIAWLLESHNADGSIKESALAAAGVDPGQLAEIEAAIGHIATLDTLMFEPARTLSVVGDMHFGYAPDSTEAAAAEARWNATAADLATLDGLYLKRVYVGDMVHSPGPTNEAAALAWMNALDDEWDVVVGNHDVGGDRDADAWAAIYGYADQNWAKDYGPFRVIGIGPDTHSPSSTLSSATLEYLDDQLRADRKDTIILCHFPLHATAGVVVKDDGTWAGFSTFQLGDYSTATRYVQPDAEVRAILNRHTNARVWLCGHSHSPIDAPDIFTQAWLGSRSIAVINAGAPVYTDSVLGAAKDDPPRSIFLTMLPDRVEVRVRNHELGAWEAYNGRYVVEMPWGVSLRALPDDANPAVLVATLNSTLAATDKDGATTISYPGTPTYNTKDGETGVAVPHNTYNNFHNPHFPTGTHGAISGFDNCTYAHTTEWSYMGPGSVKVSTTGANSYVQRSRTVPSGETWITSWVVHNPGASDRTFRVTCDGSEIVAPTVVGAGQTVRLESDPITGTGSTSQFRVYCTDSVSGDVWYLGHTQLEPGDTVTGVIPQTDAAGVADPGYYRLPDDTSGFWYRTFSLTFDPSDYLSASQGAIVIRAAFDEASGVNRLIHHNPGGDNRFYLERRPNGRVRLTVGSGIVCDSHTLVNDTDMHTYGINWRDGRALLYIDGVLEANTAGSDFVESWGSSIHIGYSGRVLVAGVYAAERELTDAEHASMHAASETWV